MEIKMNAYNQQPEGIVRCCVMLQHSALFNCRDPTMQIHTYQFLYNFNANIGQITTEIQMLCIIFNCFDHQQDRT